MTKSPAKHPGVLTVKAQTNFEVWKESVTPEFIANHHFIALACGACPAQGKTCSKYDAACRGNFLKWARTKAESGEKGDVSDEQ